jgi:hypothetical protein
MKLKIRIKEVVEKWRDLTIYDDCVIYVGGQNAKGIIGSPLQTEAEHELDRLGYVSKRFNERHHRWEGLFRKETIRDATDEETVAWHKIEIGKLFRMLIKKMF